jgi:hypothetical protein
MKIIILTVSLVIVEYLPRPNVLVGLLEGQVRIK